KASEELAADALAEVHLALEAVTMERWDGGNRGDMAAAVEGFATAERRHQPAARALEANLAEAGRLRVLLRMGGM
ncbi:MAG: hypothetical protein AAB654_07300, partial [Acidobacteriota bacterium]